jgi:hypothetical protein
MKILIMTKKLLENKLIKKLILDKKFSKKINF